jgi:hypothetical protein
MVDAKDLVLDLEQDVLADRLRRDIVTVGGKREQAILVHLAEEFKRRVVIGLRQGTQMRNLLLPAQDDLLPVSAVNPLVSRFGQPGSDILIGLGE